jgi:hypothetical protein
MSAPTAAPSQDDDAAAQHDVWALLCACGGDGGAAPRGARRALEALAALAPEAWTGVCAKAPARGGVCACA